MNSSPDLFLNFRKGKIKRGELFFAIHLRSEFIAVKNRGFLLDYLRLYWYILSKS